VVDGIFNGLSEYTSLKGAFGFCTWVDVPQTPHPEPGTILLLASELVWLAGLRRQKETISPLSKFSCLRRTSDLPS
jgi:hypothetical protein